MIDSKRWAWRLGTWFGCGNSPFAPGTVGAFGAIPLHLCIRALGPAAQLAAIAATTAAGLWASERMAEELGEKDPSQVVIDEVAGTLIALGLVNRRGPIAGILAFSLFRLLDVIKPGPIDHVQRLEPAGLGIMADDLLAGLAAGLLARVLSRR
ncbi:MAG TPA: phosphatidylglycerophosphatase A [Polyangiaceae bacterium]|jgi:phosphatidylglycerophosphatase A